MSCSNSVFFAVLPLSQLQTVHSTWKTKLLAIFHFGQQNSEDCALTNVLHTDYSLCSRGHTFPSNDSSCFWYTQRDAIGRLTCTKLYHTTWLFVGYCIVRGKLLTVNQRLHRTISVFLGAWVMIYLYSSKHLCHSILHEA